MAIHDSFSEFTLDDIHEDSPESELCIPEDPIEDLEWFPNFTDDYISLSGFLTTPERKTISSSSFPATPERKTVSLNGFPATPERETEENDREMLYLNEFESQAGIPSKRPRSKRGFGRVPSLNVLQPLTSPENRIPVKNKPENFHLIGRICSHCQADKTPQWRMGPKGPKTLCNACGVRYKSGRLVPEYRPASSPSFDSQVHSNSHKKIMKMRCVREE